MLEVYAIDISEPISTEQYIKWLNQLSFEQQVRVKGLCGCEKAKQILLGDILIRYLACKKLCIENKDILIMRNAYGKPYLRGYTNFHYNLSHSGKWVICAIAEEPVGVDIEQVKTVDLRVAKRFFSRKEYEILLKKPVERRQTLFYFYWTNKESYVKYIGKGFSLPLNSFSVLRKQPGVYKVDIDESCVIINEMLSDEYVFSICCKRICNLHLQIINVNELILNI